MVRRIISSLALAGDLSIDRSENGLGIFVAHSDEPGSVVETGLKIPTQAQAEVGATKIFTSILSDRKPRGERLR